MKATIGLPMYNSGRIAWLALESLCRQKDVNFEWELIICEEQNDDCLGVQGYLPYEERLKQVGCSRIKFITLDKWMPLGDKWKLIADKASDTDVFFLQAADCFAQPYRLIETVELMDEGYDWVQSKKGIFYHIQEQKEILYNHNLYDHPCALNMAFTTKLAKTLRNQHAKRGVDTFLKRHCMSVKPDLTTGWNHSDNWLYGVDTHGLNNISPRENYFINPVPPFEETTLQIANLLPIDICERLQQLS